MIKVLFLAANPMNTELLRIDEEIRKVKRALRLARYGKSFDLETEMAVRYGDLQDLLLHHQPDIIHFSGHGDDSGEIMVQDENGLAHPIPVDALASLFAAADDNVRCVLLNACYSDDQAAAIAGHVSCVVGMSDAITDDMAIEFSPAFYRGLAYGRDVASAFALALNQIDLSGSDESQIPRLLVSGTDPAELIFDFSTADGDAVPPAPGEPPYLGLQYYDTDDADRFFGREALTADLVGYLRDHDFLAVIGASGSGKSSLVRAGIVPALSSGAPLADGTLPPSHSNSWPVYIFTPTARPLRALAAELSDNSHSTAQQSTLMNELAQAHQTLALFAARLAAQADTDRVLLVVDQFEELFTLCERDSERQAFLHNLLTASASDGSATVIITLRADYYHRCAEFADLRAMLEQNQRYIGVMLPEELQAAIEEPAKRGGWSFEAGLVDQLLGSVVNEPGALPLLSHALLETWNRRQGRQMTFTGYHDAGGVRGAIASRADAEFTDLTDDEQAIAKRIFLRLTDLDEEAADTRRRVDRDELLNSVEESEEVDAVLQTLVNARLITVRQDEVEVAHEALIREWPMLRNWLAEDRENIAIHRRLTEAAEEWDDLGRDPDDLWRGTRLEQVRQWASSHDDAMNQIERAFLAESLALFKAAEAAKIAALEEEVRHAEELAREANARQEAEAARAGEAEARQEAETKRAEEAEQSARIVRRRAYYLGGALVVALLAMLTTFWFWNEAQYNYGEAEAKALYAILIAEEAESQKQIAEERLDRFNAAVSDVDAEQLLTMAQDLVEAGDNAGATALLTTIAGIRPALFTELQPAMLSKLARSAMLRSAALRAEGETETADALRDDLAILVDAAVSSGLINFDVVEAEYAFIGAGDFVMGSDETDSLAYDDEKPTQRVSLDAFWMMRTEVTNEQYGRCVDAGVCEDPANDYWRDDIYRQRPVTDVDWLQASTYAEWVGGRLPTEAEWEYACRGTDRRIYPWGNEVPTAARLSFLNSDDREVTQVGEFPPGANGLFDMAGNVMEWTADRYVPYGSGQQTEGGSADASSVDPRTVRGGDLWEGAANVRCAFRDSTAPDEGYYYLGFRVVIPGP